MSSISVPIYRNTDVLIIGSSLAAVAAALEIKRAGHSVMLVSDVPYIGSDLAGTLQLWPSEWTKDDPLLQTIFAEDASLPVRPGMIKRKLEEALLQADVSLLFQSRPVAVLRDESNHLGGVVLASRTSLLGVTCRSVIDASDHGLVIRLAGLPLQAREVTNTRTEWTVLGRGVPASWPGSIEEIQPSFIQEQTEGSIPYRAFRLGIESSLLGEDPRSTEHVARSLLVDENVLITADLLVRPCTEMLSTSEGTAESLDQLSASQLQPTPGLWVLNSLLPISEAGVDEWSRPVEAIAFAHQFGQQVASQSTRPSSPLHPESGGDQRGAFQFAPVFLRETLGTLTFPVWGFPAFGDYDVVVSGGGTGGAPAGIAAARSGMSTLVLETQHGLGGIGTIGLISAYWFGNRAGFTAELDEEVSRYDSWSRSNDGSGWSTEVKSRVYHRMLQTAGGRAWLGTFVFGVKMEADKVIGLLVSTPFGCGLVNTSAVVDATGDSDVAAAAGAPCRQIGAEHIAVQGSGLSPRVHPGAQYQNSDHTFIDDTDPIGVTSAFVQARAKYPDAFDTVSIVNSRERRQIIGEAEISPLDILAGRTFPDTVYIARSNFDTHGFTVHPVFMLGTPDHDPMRAHVPYRCLIPQKVDGVLVTGLGMSAHRDALPLLRMQADVQNQGYAAGIAAAESAKNGVAPRDIDIRKLQRKLAEIGIIEEANLEQEDSFPLSEQVLQKAVEGDWEDLVNLAILLAHPEETREPLRQILAEAPDSNKRAHAARILGMMKDPAAATALLETVNSSAWDDGWNFRGMGQFGASMSLLDQAIIALGKTRNPSARKAIEAKILDLDGDAAFSHCRAIALSAALLPHEDLAAALERLLEKPGVRGHALPALRTLQNQATSDPNETDSRNLSLREIYLAMGLYLSGDPNGIGRDILESYALDLRGHFARYAKALLAQTDLEVLRERLA